jgi:hypothetical protein
MLAIASTLRERVGRGQLARRGRARRPGTRAHAARPASRHTTVNVLVAATSPVSPLIISCTNRSTLSRTSSIVVRTTTTSPA